MLDLSIPPHKRLHQVERSDHVATYREVAEIVGRARQALSKIGMPAGSNSAVGSLFAKAERLNRDWSEGAASDYIEILMMADEAARIAEVILEFIGLPEAREAISRITKSDMRLSTRQSSQGKDALWELDLMSFLRRRNATASFKDPPDLELELPCSLGAYGIACKKVYSENSLKGQFSKGLKQLEPYSGAGLVAFNLDDLTPARSLLQASTKREASDHLQRLNVEFIHRHQLRFHKAVVAGRCDGVWVSTCAQADVAGLSPRFNRVTESTAWTVRGARHDQVARINALQKIIDG